MKKEKQLFLPNVSDGAAIENRIEEKQGNAEAAADSPCPCCGYITIPNHGDALAYICPVCGWEVDLFIKSDAEPSDQNHQLTLSLARKNYLVYGAVLPRIRKFCREPKDSEFPA